MPDPINSNAGILGALGNLRKIDEQISKTQDTLASGLRIRNTSGVTASISFSSQFQNSVDEFTQAVKESSNGIALSQIAVTGLDGISEGLRRLSDLATQSSVATLSSADRSPLQAEADAIIEDISSIVGRTNFNGTNLLGQTNTLTFRLTDAGADDDVKISISDFSSLVSALESSDLGTQSGAESAITTFETQIDSVAEQRVSFTTVANQFERSITELGEKIKTESKSLSQIVDADFATRTALRISNRFREDSTLAVLAQANSNEDITEQLLLN